MTIKEAIAALEQCHPDAQVLFSLHFGESKEGKLVAIEHEVIGNREHNPLDIGCVYLHNVKKDFVHDEPLLDGTLFIT
jgi:hypothetical protein